MSTAGPVQSQLATLKVGAHEFHGRFVRAGSMALGALALLVAIVAIGTQRLVVVVGGAAAFLTFASAYALTYRGDGLLGRRIFVYGTSVLPLLVAAVDVADPRRFGSFVGAALLSITLSGFLLARVDLLIHVGLGLAMVGVHITRQILSGGWHAELSSTYVTAVGIVVILGISIWLFTANVRDDQAKLHRYVEEIDRVMAHAARIAKGDLAGAAGEGDSEVAETIRAMQGGLRDLVTHTRDAASALSSSAQEIAAMARQQEQGAIEQASAVGQVHRTLATLIDGSAEAAQSTEAVFRNVEMTQRTSETVAERAAALSQHTRRISALLETIKGIANKSEILALNAALEGARAGEAGRGFSLVASQMQRLAESVMESVRDVRGLVDDIDAATAATLAATEESTRLSAKATSAARQISGVLQQQRRSTEQVASAMKDIQDVTAQVSAGSSQSLSATSDLTRLAGELTKAIERFQI